MKIIRKIVVVIVTFLSGTFFTQAQETIEPIHRYIGVGIRVSVFQISELPNRTVPPNRILLNIDPFKYLRVEGHFGMYKNDYQESFNTYSNGSILLTIKENSTLFGGGVFGVYPKDNIKFIGGLRFSQNRYNQDNIDFSNGIPVVVTDKGKINILTYMLGAEYSFNKWFSIGAEFGFVTMKDNFDPADPSNPSTTSNTSISESSVVFRFYPY